MIRRVLAGAVDEESLEQPASQPAFPTKKQRVEHDFSIGKIEENPAQETTKSGQSPEKRVAGSTTKESSKKKKKTEAFVSEIIL